MKLAAALVLAPLPLVVFWSLIRVSAGGALRPQKSEELLRDGKRLGDQILFPYTQKWGAQILYSYYLEP